MSWASRIGQKQAPKKSNYRGSVVVKTHTCEYIHFLLTSKHYLLLSSRSEEATHDFADGKNDNIVEFEGPKFHEGISLKILEYVFDFKRLEEEVPKKTKPMRSHRYGYEMNIDRFRVEHEVSRHFSSLSIQYPHEGNTWVGRNGYDYFQTSPDESDNSDDDSNNDDNHYQKMMIHHRLVDSCVHRMCLQDFENQYFAGRFGEAMRPIESKHNRGGSGGGGRRQRSSSSSSALEPIAKFWFNETTIPDLDPSADAAHVASFDNDDSDDGVVGQAKLCKYCLRFYLIQGLFVMIETDTRPAGSKFGRFHLNKIRIFSNEFHWRRRLEQEKQRSLNRKL